MNKAVKKTLDLVAELDRNMSSSEKRGFLIVKQSKLIKKIAQEKKRILDLVRSHEGKVIDEAFIKKVRKICSREKDI